MARFQVAARARAWIFIVWCAYSVRIHLPRVPRDKLAQEATGEERRLNGYGKGAVSQVLSRTVWLCLEMRRDALKVSPKSLSGLREVVVELVS